MRTCFRTACTTTWACSTSPATRLAVDLRIFSEPVAQNFVTLDRDLNRAGARVGLTKSSRRIDYGGSLLFANYSDENSQVEGNVFAAYQFNPAPQEFRVLVKGDFVSFGEESVAPPDPTNPRASPSPTSRRRGTRSTRSRRTGSTSSAPTGSRARRTCTTAPPRGRDRLQLRLVLRDRRRGRLRLHRLARDPGGGAHAALVRARPDLVERAPHHPLALGSPVGVVRQRRVSRIGGSRSRAPSVWRRPAVSFQRIPSSASG